MTYKELQQALKQYRAFGLTTIKLNRKKVELQTEYDRLQNATFNLKTGQFWTNGQSLVNKPKDMGINQVMYYLENAEKRGLEFTAVLAA